MHLFIWIVAMVGLGLWSLLAWGLYQLLSLEPNWAADARGLVARLPYGEVIDRWLPGWRELAQLALELSQTAMAWVGGAAPLVTGVVWGLGALAIIGGAAVGSLIVRLLSGNKPPAPPSQAAA
jgi:hypothetical protein